MAGFAGRAERELSATGERARKRTVETREELTAQEAQVAGLARDGLSNGAIGERLFISQHTAAYHLRKVFTKLDITSRNQLGRVLSEAPIPRGWRNQESSQRSRSRPFSAQRRLRPRPRSTPSAGCALG
jgi:DNA-binding CsgD family transcriptional regulator